MSGETVMEHFPNQPHQNEENAIRYLTSFGKIFISYDKFFFNPKFSCKAIKQHKY